jgi:hypothetical protein
MELDIFLPYSHRSLIEHCPLYQKLKIISKVIIRFQSSFRSTCSSGQTAFDTRPCRLVCQRPSLHCTFKIKPPGDLCIKVVTIRVNLFRQSSLGESQQLKHSAPAGEVDRTNLFCLRKEGRLATSGNEAGGRAEIGGKTGRFCRRVGGPGTYLPAFTGLVPPRRSASEGLS